MGGCGSKPQNHQITTLPAEDSHNHHRSSRGGGRVADGFGSKDRPTSSSSSTTESSPLQHLDGNRRTPPSMGGYPTSNPKSKVHPLPQGQHQPIIVGMISTAVTATHPHHHKVDALGSSFQNEDERDEVTLVGSQSTRRPSNSSTWGNESIYRYPGSRRSSDGNNIHHPSINNLSAPQPSRPRPRSGSPPPPLPPNNVTKPIAQSLKAQTAASLIAGLGWGKDPEEISAALSGSKTQLAADSGAPLVTSNSTTKSYQSLHNVTEYLEYLSPAGSVDLTSPHANAILRASVSNMLNATSSPLIPISSLDDSPLSSTEPPSSTTLTQQPSFQQPPTSSPASITPLTSITPSPATPKDAITAEDIIDQFKNRYEDEAYSIEEFTASAAFGIQLNVDHPLANARSVSDVTKAAPQSHSPSEEMLQYSRPSPSTTIDAKKNAEIIVVHVPDGRRGSGNRYGSGGVSSQQGSGSLESTNTRRRKSGSSGILKNPSSDSKRAGFTTTTTGSDASVQSVGKVQLPPDTAATFPANEHLQPQIPDVNGTRRWSWAGKPAGLIRRQSRKSKNKMLHLIMKLGAPPSADNDDDDDDVSSSSSSSDTENTDSLEGVHIRSHSADSEDPAARRISKKRIEKHLLDASEDPDLQTHSASRLPSPTSPELTIKDDSIFVDNYIKPHHSTVSTTTAPATSSSSSLRPKTASSQSLTKQISPNLSSSSLPPTPPPPPSTPPTTPPAAEDITEAIRAEMPRFEREIKKRMYPEIFRTGDLIIKKHDIGKEMYFLSKGRVEVISGDGRTVYSTINRGSFFGELGVLFNVPRTASVRAMVDCFCMVLTRDSLDDVLQYFPNIAARFRTVAEQRMKEVSRKRSYRRRMEVKSKMEIVDELPEETQDEVAES